MKGNFWRFVAAVLILGLILWLLFAVIAGVVFAVGINYFAPMSGPSAGDPVQLGKMLYVTLVFPIVFLPVYMFAFSMIVALISYVYADLVGDIRSAGATSAR
jgi:hypothetical protein